MVCVGDLRGNINFRATDRHDKRSGIAIRRGGMSVWSPSFKGDVRSNAKGGGGIGKEGYDRRVLRQFYNIASSYPAESPAPQFIHRDVRFFIDVTSKRKGRGGVNELHEGADAAPSKCIMPAQQFSLRQSVGVVTISDILRSPPNHCCFAEPLGTYERVISVNPDALNGIFRRRLPNVLLRM